MGGVMARRTKSEPAMKATSNMSSSSGVLETGPPATLQRTKWWSLNDVHDLRAPANAAPLQLGGSSRALRPSPHKRLAPKPTLMLLPGAVADNPESVEQKLANDMARPSPTSPGRLHHRTSVPPLALPSPHDSGESLDGVGVNTSAAEVLTPVDTGSGRLFERDSPASVGGSSRILPNPLLAVSGPVPFMEALTPSSVANKSTFVLPGYSWVPGSSEDIPGSVRYNSTQELAVKP